LPQESLLVFAENTREEDEKKFNSSKLTSLEGVTVQESNELRDRKPYGTDTGTTVLGRNANISKALRGLSSEQLQEDDLELIEVLKVHSPSISLSQIIEELEHNLVPRSRGWAKIWSNPICTT